MLCKALKVSKCVKIRNRYNQVPHLTQDTNGESDKLTMRHHKLEPRGQHFPSIGDHKVQINRRAQRHNKYKTEKNINEPQKKYRLGTVSKNILLKGLNQFHGAKLTLNSDVDQDTKIFGSQKITKLIDQFHARYSRARF